MAESQSEVEKNHPAIETLKEIARCGFGQGGKGSKVGSPRYTKGEMITMARETCDRHGIPWSAN